MALLPEDRHVTLHKLEGCEVYAVHASRVTELANNAGMEVQVGCCSVKPLLVVPVDNKVSA